MLYDLFLLILIVGVDVYVVLWTLSIKNTNTAIPLSQSPSLSSIFLVERERKKGSSIAKKLIHYHD